MDNVAHAEPSKLSSLRNGSEKLLQNGRQRSFKRLKVAAASEFPPDSGSVFTRLRSRTKQKEFRIEACSVSGDSVPSSEVEVDMIPGERDSVDEKLSNNMDNAENSEPSKFGWLRNGSATPILQNGSHTTPIRRRKFKRLKVPPDCGSISARLRSRTKQKEVQIEACDNMSVSDDCVPSSEAEIDLLPGENVHLKSVDEKLSSNMEVEVTERDRVNLQEPMKDRNLPEKTSEVEAVEVQPQSIIGTKQLRGRKVSIVIGSPSKSGKVAMLTEEKNSDSGDHMGPSLAKCVSSEVLVPLVLDKAKVTVLNPIPSSLKQMNGDYGRRKKSERFIPDEERLARNPQLADVELSGLGSEDSAREKVREIQRLFHEACSKILEDEEARPRDGSRFRVDYVASQILKSKGKCLNTGNHIMGPVPGTEVGDEFQYRMELNILGIHRPNQAGIDYMRDDSKELVATSIVATGDYDDELDDSNVLIYTGQGGYVNKGKKGGKKHNEPQDQQLVMGNLALANSKLKKNPVRVIRGSKKTTLDAKNYVYDGLYLVEELWQETGPHGKLIYKFKLRRIPGQPELSWKALKKKSNKSKFRDGLCNVDISGGKERLAICAVNELDDEKAPPLIYTVKMIYPDWCRPIPPKGCGCTKRCCENCACVAKNGGEPPYNNDGDIIKAKPLVYECGPLCKCPPSCYLRSTQRGIKFQLEIFKTESRGWGVRSLNSIPMGSFICEYAGELLEDREAERLAGKDEYLFDIGKEKEDETRGFTIDAAQKGNIGRFINHSCSPNLYAQDVLYDHEETRIPHVMFFAMNDIAPLEELSYDYNYKIDQVRDADGNIKRKNCYCGSSVCTGRLY